MVRHFSQGTRRAGSWLIMPSQQEWQHVRTSAWVEARDVEQMQRLGATSPSSVKRTNENRNEGHNMERALYRANQQGVNFIPDFARVSPSPCTQGEGRG